MSIRFITARLSADPTPEGGMPDIRPQFPPIPGLVEAFTSVAFIAAGVAFLAIVLAATLGALNYMQTAIRAGVVGFFAALVAIIVGAFVDEWRPAIVVVASIVLAVIVAAAVTWQRRRDWSR